MANDFQSKRQKTYTTMRMVYDFTMGGFILGMAVILFFGDKWNLDLIASIDPVMRYGFGGLCFLYGAFRVYRAIKHDY